MPADNPATTPVRDVTAEASEILAWRELHDHHTELYKRAAICGADAALITMMRMRATAATNKWEIDDGIILHMACEAREHAMDHYLEDQSNGETVEG